MFLSLFKIALRNLSRSPLYTLINGVGLAVAIAACVMIGLYIMDELSYDKFQDKGNRLVRVVMEYQFSGTQNVVVMTGTKVGPEFQRNFPEIESYCRTMKQPAVVSFGDNVFDEKEMLFADSDFFHMFSFPLLRGDNRTVLDGPDKIVLTESAARKYFGDRDPVGKLLRLNNTTDYAVTGIVADPPRNSQIRFSMVSSFTSLRASQHEEWFTANYITYLLLDDAAHLSTLRDKVSQFMQKVTRDELGAAGDDHLSYQLEPFHRVHLYSSLDGFEPNGSITTVTILGVIGALILLIACINYANLATARAATRRTEIGIRKVLGSKSGMIFMQFIGESAAVTILAVVLAAALALALMHALNSITGKAFGYSYLLTPQVLVFILSLILLVSLISGIYPALLLSHTAPRKILKSGIKISTSGVSFRKSLIVFQFVISIFLIVTATIIVRQVRYIQNRELGYDRFHVIVLPVGREMHGIYPALCEVMALDPAVKSVSGAYEEPTFIEWGDALSTSAGGESISLSVHAIPVDLGFVETMGMNLVAGTDFSRADFQLQDTTRQYENYQSTFILNETAASRLGWAPEEAVGKTVSRSLPGTVKAVVKDFNFSSLHEEIGPLVIFLDTAMVRRMFVRISGDNIPATLTRLESIWKERVSHRPFDYHFMEEDFDTLYSKEQRSARLFSIFAAIAIVLACLGLFALSSYTTQQRTREIGIRKILGASVQGIISLVTREFIVLVLLALLIAVPISWYAGSWWLRDFAYRIPIGIWIFAVAGVIALLIAFISVSLQSVRAARTNPADALRYE